MDRTGRWLFQPVDHAELMDKTAESEPLQRLTAAEWLIIHLYWRRRRRCWRRWTMTLLSLPGFWGPTREALRRTPSSVRRYEHVDSQDKPGHDAPRPSGSPEPHSELIRPTATF